MEYELPTKPLERKVVARELGYRELTSVRQQEPWAHVDDELQGSGRKGG